MSFADSVARFRAVADKLASAAGKAEVAVFGAKKVNAETVGGDAVEFQLMLLITATGETNDLDGLRTELDQLLPKIEAFAPDVLKLVKVKGTRIKKVSVESEVTTP